MEIKDSGTRREFETGSVRDCAENKGRCDLLPLDVIANLTEDIILARINRMSEQVISKTLSVPYMASYKTTRAMFTRQYSK